MRCVTCVIVNQNEKKVDFRNVKIKIKNRAINYPNVKIMYVIINSAFEHLQICTLVSFLSLSVLNRSGVKMNENPNNG